MEQTTAEPVSNGRPADQPEPARPAAVTAAGPAACAAWDKYTGGGGGRESTRYWYRRTAMRFLRWLEPQGIGLGQVTPAVVEAFLRSRHVSPASQRTYRTALRAFFTVLAARDVLPSNPADLVCLPAPELECPHRGKTPADSPPTLGDLKRRVRKLALHPIKQGSPDFDAALVLLAGLFLGTGKIMPLSRLTRVRPRRVAEFAANLRANGVWTADGSTASDWSDEGGQHAFWFDVWVATGLMKRAPADGS